MTPLKSSRFLQFARLLGAILLAAAALPSAVQAGQPLFAPAFQSPIQSSLRFYGHGVGQIDRVKIKIDAPEVPADVGGDFTIEFWMKADLTENASGPCSSGGDNWTSGNVVIDRDIFGAGDNGDFGVSLYGGRIAFGAASASANQTLCGGTNVADNTWRHIAVTRAQSSGQMQIFVNGVLDASGTGPTGSLSYRNGRTTSYPNDPYLVFGAEKHDYDNVNYPSYSGYLDEVRISNVVRYSANFTPPSAPFTPDANTVALYHFDEGIGNCVGAIVDSSPSGQSGGACHFGGTGTPGPVYSNDVPFSTPPQVLSISRAGAAYSNAATVEFIVMFSEPVTGVEATDFSPFTEGGISGASVQTVLQTSPGVYRVSVFTGSGDGSLRLDALDDDSILNGAGIPLDGGFVSGETYVIDKTAPVVSAFSAAAPAEGVKISISTFRASDNIGVAGYMITTSPAPPAPDASGWAAASPRAFICPASGTFDLHPWVRDAAGNVSPLFAPPVNVTVYPRVFYSAPARDGWVLETSEQSGVGGFTGVFGWLRVGDDARNRQYLSILSFDTFGLPDDATVTRAALYVKLAGTTGDVSQLGSLTADIKNGFFGRAALQPGDFRAAGERLSLPAKFFPDDQPNWLRMNLHRGYLQNVNLRGTTQFRLRFALDDNNNKQQDYLLLYAGEASPADQPRLIVEYYVP